MSCILACDLGGSSFRVALVDAAGTLVDSISVPLPTPPDRDGVSEFDPDIWWHVLRQAADDLAKATGPTFDTIEAIAISAFTRTQVFLDADGQVLRLAILWRDTQAEQVLPELRAKLPTDHPETPDINAFHPLARLYLAAPDLPSLAAMVEPKDYLNFRLTGRIAIDTLSGARILAAKRLLKAAGLPENIVPQALAPTDIMGHVQPGLAGALARLATRPVLAMGNDTWASVLGLGALRPGLAYNLSGTTEVLGVLSEVNATAEGLMTVAWGGGLHQIGGPSQTGADSLVWLSNLLGTTELNDLLAQPRDPQPALFLPYLQGERVPYWNPALRGAFLGLNRRHGPVDLAYAVLEGVAMLNRIVLDRAEAASGRTVTEIRFGGGGAANETWCQIKSDITGRPVAVMHEPEPGLIGAAIVAFTAIGRFANLAAAQEAMVTPRTRFVPRPERAAFHQALFTQFLEAETALVPVSQALAGMSVPGQSAALSATRV